MKKVFFAAALLICYGISNSQNVAIANFGSNPGNIKAYKYVPANMPANAPLVVVTHGCSQSASSYSSETAWNTLADAHKFYVVYAEQQSANNSNTCFNYWQGNDNTRGQGEALSVKQTVDYMRANHSIDSARVFVTGLSAGGAMTAIMLSTYPEVFAAGAPMSGLPYRVASNSTEVYLAAVGQVDKTPQAWGNFVRAENPNYTGNYPRVAIFHGTSDIVINIKNSQEMVEQFVNVHGAGQTVDFTDNAFNGNSSVKLEQYKDANDKVVVEFYTISGMAHGTAVDPGSCYQQGGTATSLSFDVNFYSCFWAARFFDILKAPYSITGAISVSANQQGVVYSVANTAGSTYAWQVPSGATIVSGQGTNSVTVNWGSASGRVIVTETKTGGCKNGPVELEVTAGAAQPTLDAGLSAMTVPASSVCAASFASSFTLTNAGQVTLTGTTIYYRIDNEPVQNYPWSGSLTAGQSAIITLPAISPTAGSHTLRVFSALPNGNADANKSNDTLVKNFTAGIAPVVNLGNDIAQCGTSVSLDAQNAGSLFTWSTGASAQTISVSQSGAYSVTVTSNGCTAAGNISVALNTPPVASLGSAVNICAAQYLLDAGNAGATYFWSTGASTQTINVTNTGTYYVTVTSGQNCSATADVSVTLKPVPVVPLANVGNTCLSQYSFDAGNAGATYLWNTGASTQTITTSSSGTYYVTVTNAQNCSATGSASVTLNSSPTILLGAGGAICGTQQTLDAGNAGATYTWSTGDATQTINATASGSYSVTIMDVNNCSASASVSVTLNPLPNVSLQLQQDTVCVGVGMVSLQGGSPAGGVFSGSGVSGGVFNALAAGSGIHPVTYTYTDNNNCTASTSQNMVVEVCTGIKEDGGDIKVQIFPNPNSSNTLQLRIDKVLPGMEVKVLDMAGKMVLKKNLVPEITQLDVTGLAKGIYILSITVDAKDKQVFNKLIIK